jgi:hypothetical protein
VRLFGHSLALLGGSGMSRGSAGLAGDGQQPSASGQPRELAGKPCIASKSMCSCIAASTPSIHFYNLSSLSPFCA